MTNADLILHRWEYDPSRLAHVCLKPELSGLQKLSDRCPGCGMVIPDNLLLKFGPSRVTVSATLNHIANTQSDNPRIGYLTLLLDDDNREPEKPTEMEIEPGVFYVKNPWGKGYVSTKGSQRNGYCSHSFGSHYCRNLAQIATGYCLTHDSVRIQNRAQSRLAFLCAFIKRNGEPCKEMHVPGSSFCRHHHGGVST